MDQLLSTPVGEVPLFPTAAAASPVQLDLPDLSAGVQREVERLRGGQLTETLAEWVAEYEAVGSRPGYLWNWCHRAVEITTLSSVPDDQREHACDTKTLGVMWDVLLDDLADRPESNRRLLESLLSMPEQGVAPAWDAFTPEERAYGEFAIRVWKAIVSRVQEYPRCSEFNRLLRFDYLQLNNVMRYSQLINDYPELLNLVEHDLYTPHNMHIMICSTMDLMASPDFDRQELGTLRELIWHAQWMGRIGNLVTTWERELAEGDFTSGVYARAVSLGDLTFEQLSDGDPLIIEAVIKGGGHENFYLQRWNQHRDYLLSQACHVKSVDIAQLVAGFEQLICLHIGSRGQK